MAVSYQSSLWKYLWLSWLLFSVGSEESTFHNIFFWIVYCPCKHPRLNKYSLNGLMHLIQSLSGGQEPVLPVLHCVLKCHAGCIEQACACEALHLECVQFSSVQSLSLVQLFANPWITACQASLSITSSWSLHKLMSIESVMPSNHLIFCRPLLLLPPIPPSNRVFSNESTLCIRWPK